MFLSIIEQIYHLTILFPLEITLLTHALGKMNSIKMLTLRNPIPSSLLFYYLFLIVNAKLLDIPTIVDFTTELFIQGVNLNRVLGFLVLAGRIGLDQVANFITLTDVFAQAVFHGNHALVVRIKIKCQLTEFMHSVFNELNFLG